MISMKMKSTANRMEVSGVC